MAVIIFRRLHLLTKSIEAATLLRDRFQPSKDAVDIRKHPTTEVESGNSSHDLCLFRNDEIEANLQSRTRRPSSVGRTSIFGCASANKPLRLRKRWILPRDGQQSVWWVSNRSRIACAISHRSRPSLERALLLCKQYYHLVAAVNRSEIDSLAYFPYFQTCHMLSFLFHI